MRLGKMAVGLGKCTVWAVVCAVTIFLMGAPADAAVYNGSAWLTTNAQADPIPTSTAGLGAPNITFTTPAINFDSRSGGNDSAFSTFGAWIGTSPGSVILTGSPAALATGLSNGTTTGAIFQFTGSAHFHNGQAFNVAHDDGVYMTVNGVVVLDDRNPTNPTVTPFTYTGADGNFNFDFIYGECCTPPAVFKTDLVPDQFQTPEPASLLLIGAGLIGLAGAGTWRKRRSN